jgi:plastocyanin
MSRRLFGALLVGVLAMLCTPGFSVASGQSVTMAHYAFSPSSVTVHVGDSVTWTNQDQAPHDATTTSAPVSFRSPTLSTGQSWTYTFRQPGQYNYYCSIHPDMRAVVVVLPAENQPPANSGGAQAQPPPAAHHTTTGRPSTGRTAAAPSASVPAVAAPPPENTPGAAMPMPAGDTGIAQAIPAAQTTTLNPMLLVAGLVAGVTTLCLLLVGSRAEPRVDPGAE